MFFVTYCAKKIISNTQTTTNKDQEEEVYVPVPKTEKKTFF